MLWPAATWDCDRLKRRFAAVATLPDGSRLHGLTDVHTRSCTHRFTLEAKPGVVRVLDRFELGDTAVRVCVDARCRRLEFAPAVTVRSLPVASGSYRVVLRTPYATVRRVVEGDQPLRALPTVLATGDSTMTGVESFIADELGGRADVVSDAYPGGRISGEENGWLKVAREQVARDRPDVVVLSLGANEGFSIDGRRCCYPAWVNAYAKELRAVLRVYEQDGSASVLLATIPLSRFPERNVVFARVNEGIRKAAAGMRGVEVVAMDEFFTPDGYRETVPYRGRQVAVRAADGIHLNVSGQAIAARLIEAALALPRAADRRRLRAG